MTVYKFMISACSQTFLFQNSRENHLLVTSIPRSYTPYRPPPHGTQPPPSYAVKEEKKPHGLEEEGLLSGEGPRNMLLE